MTDKDKNMDFIFKHPKSNEVITITICDSEIREHMEEEARDKMDCGCQPVGETNVIECNCSDYFDDFEMEKG